MLCQGGFERHVRAYIVAGSRIGRYANERTCTTPPFMLMKLKFTFIN